MLDRSADATESAGIVRGKSLQPREILAAVPFFGSVLDAGQLDALAATLVTREFPRGAVLMRQGEMGRSMFILTDGKVGISVHATGGDRQVATLGHGEIVGEMSLLTGDRRSATVTALKRTSALEIARPSIQAVITSAPGLIHRFAGMIEQRHAELERISGDAARWYSSGLPHAEIAARMTAYFSD